MSKNMYHKKPKFGIKTRHKLHGQFSPFHLFIFVLNWQRDCEFRIVGGNICHSCEPFNRTLSFPLLKISLLVEKIRYCYANCSKLYYHRR